ncbi:porin family protein [Cellulophaga baltica]|nr:porin family protein [Cellulophaga baltica]AIZ43353.1 hypothetical protein M666_18430 [Cellulophaga baltica 18]
MQKTLLLALFTLISASLHAQNFELGARAGLNSTKLKYAESSTEKLLRPIISFTTEYRLSERWSLEGSLGYIGKGGGNFEEEEKLSSGIDGLRTKLEYISLTLILRYYLMKENKLRPFIAIGPGISYTISATQMGNDIKDDLRSTSDLSSNFGLGVKYNVKNKLFLEVVGGIDRGWSKIIRAEGESLFNHSFGVAVGVKKVL